MPCQQDDGGILPHSIQTPEELHRQQYLEIMDTAVISLDCRFSPSQTQDFVSGKSNYKNIAQFYGDGFNEIEICAKYGSSAEHFLRCCGLLKKRLWVAVKNHVARAHKTGSTRTDCPS